MYVPLKIRQLYVCDQDTKDWQREIALAMFWWYGLSCEIVPNGKSFGVFNQAANAILWAIRGKWSEFFFQEKVRSDADMNPYRKPTLVD